MKKILLATTAALFLSANNSYSEEVVVADIDGDSSVVSSSALYFLDIPEVRAALRGPEGDRKTPVIKKEAEQKIEKAVANIAEKKPEIKATEKKIAIEEPTIKKLSINKPKIEVEAPKVEVPSITSPSVDVPEITIPEPTRPSGYGFSAPSIDTDGGFYIGANISYVEMYQDETTPILTRKVTLDEGIGYGAVIGYNFSNTVRLEAEYASKENDNPDPNPGSVSSTAYMANVYYAPEGLINDWLTPFIGAGIGFANIEDSLYTTAEDDVTAYQGRLGLEFKFHENVSLDIAYRYFATEDLEFEFAGGNFSQTHFNNSAELGFKYHF